MNIVVGICLFVFPFLFAKLMISIHKLEETEKGLGPVPYCFVMGIMLIIFGLYG